ncbi:MAG: hypothetical protein AAB729_03690 [Patescibacteria group bacterium]
MKIITEETPEKVLGLLGTAFASMFFLFAVTVSNASFERMENPFPDVFAPTNVVAVLDNAASVYSGFVYENLINPAEQDYAYYADAALYIGQEAGPPLLKIAGLQNITNTQVALAEQGQVAGSSNSVAYSKYYPSADGVFSIFYR